MKRERVLPWKYLPAGAAVALMGWWGVQWCATPAVLYATAPSACPIPEYVRPAEAGSAHATNLDAIFNLSLFRNALAAKLSGAVQIDTSSFDNLPLLDEDPEYWRAKFAPFHQYLEKTFPTAHAALAKETANSWGLVYTWEGSDPSLKPLLLTAHQDVVPIQEATKLDWTYPPFDGVYDGDTVWGRGLADCKNLLIGLLETVELLLAAEFVPKRTIILGFGFDEEVGGARGAQSIATLLRERYGLDSLFALIDEGGIGFTEVAGVPLLLPGTSEKGLVDVYVDISTPGGHSLVPPRHTGIGIISDFIVALEQHPFPGIFSGRNPTFWEYQCVATHLKELEPELRKAILELDPVDPTNKANQVVVGAWDEGLLRYLLRTLAAVDIITGGVKVNALPEHVTAVVNHRVAVELTVRATIEHDLKVLYGIARKHGLGLVDATTNTTLITPTAQGHFTLLIDEGLEAAPVTPSDDEQWDTLAGVIRHVYEELAFPGRFADQPVVVAPGIATGNTDTRYYWDLTSHIYRYRPGTAHTVEVHAHGVDEHIPFDSHLQLVGFYYQYLRVVL